MTTEKVKCINCGKEFIRFTKLQRTPKGTLARGYKMKTCSKKCAVEWEREKQREK